MKFCLSNYLTIYFISVNLTPEKIYFLYAFGLFMYKKFLVLLGLALFINSDAMEFLGISLSLADTQKDKAKSQTLKKDEPTQLPVGEVNVANQEHEKNHTELMNFLVEPVLYPIQKYILMRLFYIIMKNFKRTKH